MTNENKQECTASSLSITMATTTWSIVKWLVLILAIWCLGREGTFTADRMSLTSCALWALPSAMVLLVLSVAAIGFRFHSLFRLLSGTSVLRDHIKFHFSGLLVQQLGSDACYDIVRVVSAKRMGATNPDVAAALFADRLLGFCALLCITSFSLAVFKSNAGWVVPMVCVVVLVMCIPVFFAACEWLSNNKPGAWIWRIPGFRFMAAASASIIRYRRHGGTLAVLLIVSLLSHLCVFMALYLCGYALKGIPVTLSEAVLGGAVSTVAGAVPLPLAGLGVGEIAFDTVVAGLRECDTTGEFAALFLLNRLLLFCFSVASWGWLTVSGWSNRSKRTNES